MSFRFLGAQDVPLKVITSKLLGVPLRQGHIVPLVLRVETLPSCLDAKLFTTAKKLEETIFISTGIFRIYVSWKVRS